MRPVVLAVLASLALASTGCGQVAGAFTGAILQSIIDGPSRTRSTDPYLAAGQGSYCQYGERHGWQCYTMSGSTPSEDTAGVPRPLGAPVVGPPSIYYRPSY